MIQGAIGAVVGATVAWVLMVQFGVAGPDEHLLRDLGVDAWGLVKACAQWVLASAEYPQRAALVGAAVVGFTLGLKHSAK